jgi:hypothetical protein
VLWIIAFAGSLVLVVPFGIVLRRTGTPYGTGPLTLHKLAALLGIVSGGVLVYRSGVASPAIATAVAAVGLLALAALATGGIVSASSAPNSRVVWAHRASSYLALGLSVAGALALLR